MMPLNGIPAAPAPMPSAGPVTADPTMPNCPHCKMPISLEKPDSAPAMGDKPVKAAAKKPPMSGAKAEGKPAPKKNAANAPMDELKEVLKSQDK